MKIKTIIAALALMAMPALTFAQSTKADEQLSDQLKNEISIIKADIKSLKARKKAEPENIEIAAKIEAKNAELKEKTNQKKVIDKAVSAAKKHEKQAEKAKKAVKNNDKAQKAADALRSNPAFAGKSNELLSDELEAKIDILEADIKNLKTRKKADPKNATILTQLKQMEVDLKEAKRQKKIFDKAVDTHKKATKETRQAEKTRDRLEDAMDKRNEL